MSLFRSRSVAFVSPLLSTPLWIEDANNLVKLLPADTQDAIYQAITSGNFGTPEFNAANRIFDANFGVRTLLTETQRA